MLHLYAVVEGLDDLPRLAGVAGAPLGRLAVDGVEAIVSEHAVAEVEPSDAALLEHAGVIDAAMAGSSAILPARFGRGFPDGRSLEEALRHEREELTRALERVRRCVEFGVRMLAPVEQPPDPTGPLNGADYMRARLGELERSETLAATVHLALAERSRECERVASPMSRLLLSGVYLVPVRHAAAFQDEVRRLERAHRDLGFLCTGPWPPYSFAAIGDDER